MAGAILGITDADFADIGVAWGLPAPTPELRWRHGVLEQAWESREVASSQYTGRTKKEWRPVPTDDA